MNKEHNSRGRADGGQLQTPSTVDRQSAESTQEGPALGLIAESDLGVIDNLVAATEADIPTYVIDTTEGNPIVVRVARLLDATVIEPPVEDATTQTLHNVLATYAQTQSEQGIIIPDDSTQRIDIDRTLKSYDGEAFVGSAITEKASLEPNVLVAIPAYNEAGTIADVVHEARRHADQVIVIDDSSRDATVERAHTVGAEVIEHEHNKGYGGALHTAFTEAAARNADHLVILDGDGQHDPSDIPDAVEIQEASGADIVIGSRFADNSETKLPLYRRFGIEVVNTLTNLSMGVIRPRSWVRDTQSGFRTYNKRAIESLSADGSIGDGMSASTDILHHAHRHNYELEEFGTTIDYEVENASSQNPVSHGITLVMNLLQTIERDRPVTTLGIPGFVSSFIGLGFGYWTFHHYIQTGTFPLGLAVTSTFFALAGIFACFTAIILHSLNTHLDE